MIMAGFLHTDALDFIGLRGNGNRILNMRMKKNLLWIGLGALFAAPFCRLHGEGKAPVDLSKLPPPAAKQNVTYDSDIKPIFDQSCVRCHHGPKAKGKLHLDTLAGALKGGEDGNEIVPGKSAGSGLVINIAHLGDPDDYMPPPGNKAGIGPLTKDQIGLIRAWIDQGAK